nr:uncharacterized protein LOC107439364 [Parasteatoda tepidariorum]
MELNALKTQRKGLRIAFTHTVKKIETELDKEVRDLKALSILKVQLNDKFQRLEVCQNAISEQLLQNETTENAYNEDFEESENYRDTFLERCAQINSEEQLSVLPTDKETRKFKLPKIELKKFSGEAKDYLTFWSQFQKIHDDKYIADEDKMQYLLQSMEPKSKAERLILSFPATAANYSKAIEQLKERFGREDLLVQIYVRDLLNLVMKNAATGRAKTDLPSLYDELEGKLRSLESLGRTQEKYGDFLTPLVESCLPEEVLVAWERSRNHDSTEKGDRSLEQLMNFLRQEVKGEEMVLLARTGFDPHPSHRNKNPRIEQVRLADSATAASLVNSSIASNAGKRNCIFCDKSHPSEKCFSAKKMSLIEKQQILLKKGACFSCLKKANHISKFCDEKNNLKCSNCNYNHFDIMCSKLKNNDQKSISKESSLSNSSQSETVYLQTLCVLIRSQGREKIIRCAIDTGSQSSYVSENIIRLLKAWPLRKETVIHALFGGNETKPKQHEVFSIEVSNLRRTFVCCFEVLSEEMICGFIPKIEDREILNELKEKEIDFSDSFIKESKIDLLIGSDVIGKLLTGNSVELQSGLTAIETKLGWTVFGKRNSGERNILKTLSMHSIKVPVNKLWELETLGISDPNQTEKKETELDLNDFNKNLKILPDGRYEVELPWKYNSANLPTNKELVWKRHERMINRLSCGEFFTDYQKVFEEWENLNIIERVPDFELRKECHYLYHRPVIKLESLTTKVRPVFDASAAEKGKPSLNECLLKGINLIELIPDIIDRFRMYPIGISGDIEKAFLMLSIAPKDRDFLRFFFPSNDGPQIYRHCRVVFGISASPFLLNASIMHLLENSPPQYSDVAQKLKSAFYVDNCISGVFHKDEQDCFIEHAKLIMSNGCFNLRSFESNVAGKNVDKHSGDTSVLGIIWNLDNDTLRCCTDIDALTCDTKITKRLILGIVQTIFDPIGLLTPATLLPKLLLQELWKLKIGWDDELVYTSKCSVKGCKLKEIVRINCNVCNKNYCLKHRHPDDHKCSEQKVVSPAQAAGAAALARAQNTRKPIFQWFSSQSASTDHRRNVAPLPEVSVTTAVQGSMTEDEALALALHKSLNENAPKNIQEQEDMLLAQALAQCDDSQRPQNLTTRRNTKLRS